MKKQLSLKERYEREVARALRDEFGIENLHAQPRIEKIVVNMGTGDRLRDKVTKERLLSQFAAITGQKPKLGNAKLSVAGFSIRKGMPVGISCTLRGARMWSFLEKTISVVLPRLRDFRGVSGNSFDKQGNYTLGFSEHTVFPEVDLGSVDRPHGLEVIIVIKNSDPDKSKSLLEMLGMPFAKQ